MAGFLFNIGAERLAQRSTIWETSDIRARLIQTADTHVLKDSDNITGMGIAATTQPTSTTAALSCTAPTKSDANDRVSYCTTVDTITFTAVNAGVGACDRMLFFHFVEGGDEDQDDAASFPIAVVDITAVVPNGGDIVVTIPTTNSVKGFFYLQQ